jgi:hypothetical protein
MYDKVMTGLLLVSSVLTFALLAYAAYDENFGTDWYHYQSEYRQQLLARAGSERERQAAERFVVRQEQLYLPELGRIDRCGTCHLAIDDPEMKDAAQPLTAHPGEIMKHHPKERFGCTICHRGQGRATTAADAHGPVPHWPDTMLSNDEIDRSCAMCHLEFPLPGVPRFNAAMALFQEKACISCHKLRGQGGDAGPDITHAGEIHDAEWHFRHFKDPKSEVATSEMPNLNLSDEEAEALVFLMMSLTGEAIPTEYLSNPKPHAVDVAAAGPIDPLALKGYVGSIVCVGCHQGLHAEAVDGWGKSLMSTTYERIKDEPVKDNCLPCHTTGFNPETGHYSEEGVGCEGCHGAGGEAVKLVLSGKVSAHKEAIRLNPDSSLVCARCHNPHVPVGTHAEYYRRQPARFSQAGSP